MSWAGVWCCRCECDVAGGSVMSQAGEVAGGSDVAGRRAMSRARVWCCRWEYDVMVESDITGRSVMPWAGV